MSITNAATGVVTNVVTNADGVYSAPNLLPGTYSVAVAFDGFNSQTKSGLTLTIGAELPVDFEMSIGNVAENVEVSGRRRRSTPSRRRCATTSAARRSVSCR